MVQRITLFHTGARQLQFGDWKCDWTFTRGSTCFAKRDRVPIQAQQLILEAEQMAPRSGFLARLPGLVEQVLEHLEWAMGIRTEEGAGEAAGVG